MIAKNNDIEIRKKLDTAIKGENIEEIMSILNNIPDCEPEIDVEKFSESVKNKCNTEVKVMKSKISMKIVIAVAAVVAVTGVSVGAATLLKQFSFFKDGSYVTVTSNEDLSEDEASKLADNMVSETNDLRESNTSEENVVKVDNDTFEDIRAGEIAYNMKVVLPEIMPDLELSEVTGSQMYKGENSSVSTIWAVYGDADKKAFCITTTKNDFDDKDEITSISTSDAKQDGDEFISEKGYKFNVLKDSDESSDRVAKIITTIVGDYEYSLVFYNFDDKEIDNVVNSLDLNEYK